MPAGRMTNQGTTYALTYTLTARSFLITKTVHHACTNACTDLKGFTASTRVDESLSGGINSGIDTKTQVMKIFLRTHPWNAFLIYRVVHDKTSPP